MKAEQAVKGALGAGPLPRVARPLRGEAVPVARWISAGASAVLLIRHRRDGLLQSETWWAERDRHGVWEPTDTGSGAAPYPDIWSDRPDPKGLQILGWSESLLPGSQEDDPPVRMLEIMVGTGVTGVTCSADGATREEEISPLGIVLVGANSQAPARIHFSSQGRALLDSAGAPVFLTI